MPTQMLTTRRSAPASPRAAAVLIALAGALASCSDATGPDVARQDRPFYYYQDQKIYLSVDARRLTVQPEAEADTGRVRALLAQRGVAVDSMRLADLSGHWTVHLPPGTWPRRAEDAARWLRLSEGIRFASVVYRAGGNCPLYLLNRLMVQFRPAVSQAAIDELNASTGVRNEHQHPGTTRSYEYPAGMSATPLELAAHYHRQGIVAWAEPDRIDGCLRPGGDLPG